MDMRLKILLVSLTLIISNLAFAESLSYKIDTFEEDYDAEVPVSGSIMAAYLATGALNYVATESLYIYVVPEKKEVNISVVSIDGHYSADIELTHTSNTAGWINIDIPSEHKKALKKYAHNELVAYVFADSKDGFGLYVQEVFPSSWGKPTNGQRVFFINTSGISPEFYYKDKSGHTITVPCKEIQNKLTRAFNHSCIYEVVIAEKPTLIFVNPTPEAEGSSSKKFLVWSGHK
ncbi:hypothetical protein L2737_06195 [Shewanella electrodiphila]|uniref:Uncharacterized protein n=1 Tax=Shewanella electrodiphila TaxID=934143 RepID=A0ABT0KME3_9GAMM|nr:hypothetical protein [Shewanella electrodiphila]MCL1044918.1 hypothetical protein [Shewanella electrodiphila]